jgi:fructokinase
MGDRFLIVGLGEVLWDVFPDGARFGGAPANFASHAAMLGAESYIVSQVGDDELGRRAITALASHGVNTDFVALSQEHSTGSVQVKLDARGQPRYTIARDVAWDFIGWSSAMESLAARANAVCFGTLAQRSNISRNTIRHFVDATPPNCLRIFDVNLRQKFYNDQIVQESLDIANAVKLNNEELQTVAQMCGLQGDVREQLIQLLERYNLRLVALTKGAEGAVLFDGKSFAECAAENVAVTDTVGAGDAFSAAMALGWLRRASMASTCQHACRIAAYVCSQAGAVPELPPELTHGAAK